MATFTLTTGTDVFRGTSVADDFYLSPETFSERDLLLGGGNNSPVKDRLFLTGTGGVSLPYATFSPHTVYASRFGGFEQIYLHEGGSTLFLYMSALQTVSGSLVEIFGTGEGADTVRWATGENYDPNLAATTVIINTGGGNDKIYASPFCKTEVDGGSGNDEISSFYNNSPSGTERFAQTLSGGDGDDFIFAGNMATARGGNGSDILWALESGAILDGGDGIDYVTTSIFNLDVSFSNVEGLFINRGSLRPGDCTLFNRIKGTKYDRAGPIGLDSFPGFLSEASAFGHAAAGSCCGVK